MTEHNKYLHILIQLILASLIVATYHPVKDHDFINLDDDRYVTANNHVRYGISLENVIWAFRESHVSNWHPITWLSHMVDCELFGLNPSAHHINSMLIHILNSLLLFNIFYKMTWDIWRSSFVAALFALHPLHVESVAWIAERKDLLCAFFWFLTMFAYLKYVERPCLKKYIPVIIFFSMGLLSKPMIVTLPFVLLLLDYWPLKRFKLKNAYQNNEYSNNTFRINKRPSSLLVLEKAPLFLLSITSSIITFIVQNKGGAVTSIEALPIDIRVGNAIVSYLTYITKTFWPVHLSILYPHPLTISYWKISIAFIILSGITFFILRKAKSKPSLAVGWLWYLVTLVPVIGFIQIGSQAMADRYTYIPLIGLFIIISWIVPDFKKRYFRIFVSTIAVLFILTFALLTGYYLSFWKNSISLFEHTLDVTQNNEIIHFNIACAYAENGNITKAIYHYKTAIRIKPNNDRAYNNLGTLLAKQSRYHEAIKYYREAIRIKPDDINAYTNMGVALLKTDQYGEAIKFLEQAIKIDPDSSVARKNLGLIFLQTGMYKEAIAQFKNALKNDPHNPFIHYYIGKSYTLSGDTLSAYKEYDIIKSLNTQLADNLKVILDESIK